jgi:hypothetical protein
MKVHPGGPSLLAPLQKPLPGHSAVPLLVAGSVNEGEGYFLFFMVSTASSAAQPPLTPSD